MTGATSTATTSAPLRAAGMASAPLPQPTSSNLTPGRRSTQRRARSPNGSVHSSVANSSNRGASASHVFWICAMAVICMVMDVVLIRAVGCCD
jgi:hypothetical protein